MSTAKVVRNRRTGACTIDGQIVGRIERTVRPYVGGSGWIVAWRVFDSNGEFVTAQHNLSLAKRSLPTTRKDPS